MPFGQTSGPPASTKQIAYLKSLLRAEGHDDFRTARHVYGLTQRPKIVANSEEGPPTTTLAHAPIRVPGRVPAGGCVPAYACAGVLRT